MKYEQLKLIIKYVILKVGKMSTVEEFVLLQSLSYYSRVFDVNLILIVLHSKYRNRCYYLY